MGHVVHTHTTCRRPYGFWRFILDCFLTIITGGFWIIWIFVREMRKKG